MYSFYQLTVNECLKLTKKRSFFIPFLIMMLVSLGIALVIKKFFSDADFGVTGYMEMLISLQGGGSFYTFLCMICIASIVSIEFRLGTIKMLLIRSHSRSKILASKYVALLLYIAVLLIFTLIVGSIIGLLVLGSNGGLNAGDILEASGYTLLYTWVYVTIVFMVSTLTKSTGATIGIVFLVNFLEDIISMLISRYDFAKYVLFLNLDLQMYQEGTPPIEGMSLGFSVAVILVYMIAFLALTFYVFKKRDVA